ncbi:MAG: DUF4838 domain-containing protein, partial [Planctomycetota bacterium]
NDLNAADSSSKWTVAWKGFTEFSKGDRARKPFFKVTFAADELAKYMGKVLDEKVAVVPWEKVEGDNIIYITEEKYLPKEIQDELAGKAKDTVLIKYPYEIEGKKVCLIASRDHYAHDFAAYYFLTKFMNVHWVGPGELGEVYKTNKEWKIPEKIEVLDEPKLAHRFWYMGSFTGRNWLGASSRMSWHHALGQIFNPEKYAKTNPEVYPVSAKGVRFIPKNKHGWQPCTSHPKSIEIATQAVLDFFKTYPGRSAASLSVNDGAGNICMCKSCLALDIPDAFAAGRRPYLSDRFFTFYNTVMENVLKVKPDANIAVFSYGVTKKPPTRVKIHPKIIVFQVVPTVRNMVDWAKTGAGMGMHYWTYDGGYLQMRPKMKVVKELVQIMSDIPGGGFYSENIAFWPSCAPNFYAMSKILWNPDETDVAATYQEFYDLAYGERAGKYIGEFYRRWEEMYYRQSKAYQYNPIYTWRRYSQFDTFRRYDFDFMDKMMERAEKAEMSEKESKRLGYLKTYYKWLRGNAELVLITRELKDEDFLAENKYDSIMAKVSEAVKFLPEFEKIYKEEIFADNTGWLIDKNRKLKKKKNTYDLFISQVRNLTVSNFDEAIGSYMDELAKEKEKAAGKKHAISFFKKSTKRYPQLKGYFTAVVNQLEGKVSPNIVASGDFENAPAGLLIRTTA